MRIFQKKIKDENYFEHVSLPYMRDSGISYLPECATEDSAGYDFMSPVDFFVNPHSYSKVIYTNVKAHIKKGQFLALFVRSSVGFNKFCTLANNLGVIDGSYYNNDSNEGNIGFKLYNSGELKQEFKKGDKIIQGIFIPFDVARNGNLNKKRKGGFGSTGI